MATATESSVDVALRLNNGSTASGAIKTVALKIGGSSQKIDVVSYTGNLSTSRNKAIAIANSLRNLVDKSVYEVQESITSRIQE